MTRPASVGIYTAIHSTSPAVAVWDMAPDRTTLIGFHVTIGKIALSTDQGATWSTPNAQTFAGGVLGMHYLANGEVLVHAGITASAGKMWKSSGWPTNPATATFSVVDTAAGGTDAYFNVMWGFSTFDRYLVACEYGPKVGPSDMARYVRFSKDYGATFTTIFDLYTELQPLMPGGWDGSSAHMHGAAYDPWWDAIWLANGDWGNGVPPNIWLSLDHGATWTVKYTDHQVTSIIALPTCVLFVTDTGTAAADGHGNGILRATRVAPGTVTWDFPVQVDTSAEITFVGNRAYLYKPNDAASVALLAMGGETGQPSRLYATTDGQAFSQLWVDTNTVGDDLKTVVGPTLDGKLHGFTFKNADLSYKSLELTPA